MAIRWRTVLATFALTLGLGSAANGQADSDYTTLCADPHPDVRLLACSVIIQLGQASGEALANAYSSRGTADMLLGSADRAITDFDSALMLSPDRVLVLGYRGQAYLSKGNDDRAIADFDRAVALDPHYADALYGRASAWRAKGDNDRAIADYSKVIALDADYLEAYAFRGLAYRAKDDLVRAIGDFTQMIRLNPDDAQVYTLRGSAYRDSGDGALALADFDAAIRIDPGNAGVLENRGFTELVFGQYTEAGNDFRRAIAIQPAYSYNALWLDLARRRAGRADAAEIANITAKLDATAWPAPLLRYYAGQGSAEDVRAAAAAGGTEKSRSNHACEAAFYIGEFALARGDNSAARDGLQRAAATCSHSFMEYGGALRELARLP